MSEITNALKDMTPEQKAALKAELAAEEKAAKEKVSKDREAYKTLVDETVMAMFESLKKLSDIIVQEKVNAFKAFESILEMKQQLYGVKESQQSHQFTSLDGRFSIKLGHRIIDNYDDTKSAGVAKVQNFLKGLSKDENSAMLVQTVMGLLKSDDKGNLKPNRVMELEKLADKSGDPDFIDGIRIIKASHSTVRTCQFVTVSYKDDKGVERVLPLSMSAAE